MRTSHTLRAFGQLAFGQSFMFGQGVFMFLICWSHKLLFHNFLAKHV